MQHYMMASSRGTALELGIGPLLTATILMQLLVAGKIIDGVNHSLKEDRIALQTATKLLAVILSFAMALAHVLSGAYGSIAALGPLTIVLLVVQLFGGCVVGILLDELLQKGYGIGSGLSLFPAVLISSDLVSKVSKSRRRVLIMIPAARVPVRRRHSEGRTPSGHPFPPLFASLKTAGNR